MTAVEISCHVLRCDYCFYDYENSEGYIPHGEPNVLREMAEDWTTDGIKDWCPNCSAHRKAVTHHKAIVQ